MFVVLQYEKPDNRDCIRRVLRAKLWFKSGWYESGKSDCFRLSGFLLSLMIMGELAFSSPLLTCTYVKDLEVK